MVDSSKAFGLIVMVVIAVMVGAVILAVMTQVVDKQTEIAKADAKGVSVVNASNGILIAANATNYSLGGSTLNVECSAVVNKSAPIPIPEYPNGSAFHGWKCYPQGLIEFRVGTTGSINASFLGQQYNITYTGSQRQGSVNASEQVGAGFTTGASNNSTYFSLGILAVVLALLGGMFLTNKFGSGEGGGGLPSVNIGNLTGGFER